MKYIITLLIIIILFISCRSSGKFIKIPKLEDVTISDCELDSYWSQKFLKYESHNYQKYNSRIDVLSTQELNYFSEFVVHTSKIKFEDEILNIQFSDLKHKDIFTQGILYPNIINHRDKKDVSVEELTCLSKSYKVKRFKLWISYPKMANLELFVFELTNNLVTKKSNWNDFIKNAKLTFIISNGFQI